MTRNLILILGDQLSRDISSLDGFDPAQDRVLMAELWDEATYVKHHKKKIVFLFSAMRHFAAELEGTGYEIDYIKLDAEDNAGSFRGETRRAVERYAPERVIVTHPGEWRVLNDMSGWEEAIGVPVEIRADDRFLCSLEEFGDWADGKTGHLRMEGFYRMMRRRTGYMMTPDGKPEGGDWNYDSENREPADQDMEFDGPKRFDPDETTQEVIALVNDRFADHFGDAEPFWFAVTRADALTALWHFLRRQLKAFGPHQDAMLAGERFLNHSMLSVYMNAGLLSPQEVCEKALKVHYEDGLPINSTEGFLRQILGWREFMRGIYWRHMPDYRDMNVFNHRRKLPAFYWTGETDMACLKHCITQTREEAHSHHIQRLMVTGNFALIAQVHPKYVHEWYLVVYADAYEWVELPNTLGMSQFGDGGIIGTKPYAASANYIDKMSNFCSGCRYDPQDKDAGEDACPFNYLFWDFMVRHRDTLEGIARMKMIYTSWDRMGDEKKDRIRHRAQRFLDDLEKA